MESRHRPVLLAECLEALAVRPGGVYVDCTLDGGGHAEGILDASSPGGRLVGLDLDPTMIELSRARLARFGARARLLHANFADLGAVLAGLGLEGVDGLLADLGMSSNQLDDPGRGLSFRAEGPLDMRLDPTSPTTLAGLLASLSEEGLETILRDYGEERHAARVARAVKRRFDEGALRTTRDLAQTVASAIPRRDHPTHHDPATKSFQALRIAVNGELASLEALLQAAVAALKPGGRAAIISYHSLEDRLVRHGFRRLARPCTCPSSLPVCVCGRQPLVKVLTGRPVTAGEAELATNPRARSAKLRVAERMAA